MWLYRVQLRTKGSKGIELRANGRNIVGCYMLRLFAHPAAFYCVFLGVVASVLNTTATRTQQHAKLLAQQCCELLRILYLYFIRFALKNTEKKSTEDMQTLVIRT